MDSQSSAEEFNQAVLPTVVPIVKETEPGIMMDGLSVHAGHFLLGFLLPFICTFLFKMFPWLT